MSHQAPSNALVGSLGRHFFLGRSTAHLPGRAVVFQGRLWRARLERLAGAKSPAARAERGRLLRLLGEPERAAAELDAALERDPGLASAHAWRWELGASRGARGAAGIERAVRLEPGSGWWRMWRALARADADALESESRQALDDVRAAAERLPGNALPLAVDGLVRYKLGRLDEAAAVLDQALRLEPGLEWAWRLRAMCRKEQGRLDECLEDCLGAMRLDENAGLLFIMLGLHRDKTDTRRSIEAATRHIEANPRDYWAYAFRADNRRSPEIGENLGALEDLKTAVEIAPKRAWAWAYLSRCHVTLGDFRAGGEAMARAVALDPDCGWIAAWHGELLRRSGDVAGAKKALDRAVALFPGYELAYAWRGSAARALGKPREAIADLDVAIALKPHTLDLCLYERMHARRALGLVGPALEDIRAASRLNPKYVWEAEPRRFAAGLAELDAEIKRRPRSPLAHFWRGDVLMRMRDFASAEKALTRAVSGDCAADALVLRGRARCELGKWKAAHADFGAAIAREPRSPFAYAWRGRARMLQGSNAAAIADFDRALKHERNSAWIMGWKGEAEFRLGRHAAAEKTLTKALNVHVKFADAFLWRGAARLKAGRDGAWEDLTRALELHPGNARALYYRGALSLKLGRPGEARGDLERALEEPGLLAEAEIADARRLLAKAAAPASGPAGRVEAARSLQRQGRHEEAAAVYGELLAAAPDDVELLALRGEAWRCLGRYDLTLADHDRIVALRPGDADALSNRVEPKRHLFDFAGGLADADAAIQLDPRSASAWVLRAECLRSLGRWEEAVESAGTAIACDGSWSWAYVVRAKALRQKGDLEAALADTRAAEKARPDAYARGWRAEILRKAGRLKEALADISAASALQPSNAWFLALRGQIQCELGAKDKGLADLAEAMRLDVRCSCDYDFLGSAGPDILRDEALSWVWAWRGGVRRGEGRLPEALADLDRAAALAPDCFWIVAWRGEVLLRSGRPDEGLAELRRALAMHPRYVQALVWTGQALLERGDAGGALKSFDAALAAAPNDVWALIGRGVCLEKAGRAADAAAAFARAKDLAPALFEGAKAS